MESPTNLKYVVFCCGESGMKGSRRCVQGHIKDVSIDFNICCKFFLIDMLHGHIICNVRKNRI